MHRAGLFASFTAELDPKTLAGGEPLPKGLWDLYANFGVLGLYQRRRVTLTEERQPAPVLPEPAVDQPPSVVGYFTEQTAALCLDVGLIKHKSLRQPKPVPTPESDGQSAAVGQPSLPPAAKKSTTPAKKPSFTRRVRRRLTRLVSG